MTDNNKQYKNFIGLFKDIRKLVTQDSEKEIDNKIDKISQSVAKFSSSKSRYIFSDVLKTLYGKDETGKTNIKVDEVLKDFQVNNVQPETERINRYTEYKEIVQKIPYAKRALEVIKDNIISPDDYMTSALKIITKNTKILNNTSELYIKIFEIIKTYFNLDEYLSEIIESTLYLGDYFCEIIDSHKEYNKYMLNENINNIKESQNIIRSNFKYKEDDDNISTLDLKFIITEKNEVSLTQNKIKRLNKNDKNTVQSDEYMENKLKNLFLNFYDPSTVVRLGDKICLGYLIFPKFLSKINAFTNLDLSQNDIQQIFDKLLKKLKMSSKNIEDNPELKTMVAKLIVYNRDYKGSANEPIRFVPDSNIVHFKLPSIDNAPYGKSIFFGQEFLAKLIILLESTLATQRISASTEKRVISVEMGLPRDAKNLIEEMKRQFRKKKYSIDSIGTIREVPSMASTFENIYLPMKDGKKFVEFDTMQGVANVNDRVDDLKLLRDQFVAGLNVPPAYLSLEENVESRSLLSHENLIFSRSIVNYQKVLSKSLTELLYKVYTCANENPTNQIFDIHIVFTPPRSLKLELDKEYYDNLASLIGTLEQLGVDRDYIISKYLLNDLTIDEVEKMQISNKIDKVLGDIDNNEQNSNGGSF